MTRTPDQIVERIRALTTENDGTDAHGVERSRLLEGLPVENAREFLRAPAAIATWEPKPVPSLASVLLEASAALPELWNRANSRAAQHWVQRSMAHFRGLLWLLDDESLSGLVNVTLVPIAGEDGSVRFDYGGKPSLVALTNLVAKHWAEVDAEAARMPTATHRMLVDSGEWAAPDWRQLDDGKWWADPDEKGNQPHPVSAAVALAE